MSQGETLNMNQKGISLVELMIAVGVGSGLMLVLGSVMTMNQSAKRSLEQRLEMTDLKLRIERLLDEDADCALNFTGVNPNVTTNILNLRESDAPNPPILRFTSAAPNNRINHLLEITRMQLLAATPPIPIDSSGHALLRVTVNRIGTEFGSSSDKVDIPVLLYTNRTGTIKTCSAERIELNCVSARSVTGGTSTSVFCPAGYKVTGGGLHDTDISKNDHFNRYILPTAANPWGGWFCDSDDPGGTLTCTVICCR